MGLLPPLVWYGTDLSSHTIPISFPHMAIIRYHFHSPYCSHVWEQYGFLRNTYLSHRCGFGMGLIKAPIPFPYHSFPWQSTHTIPIAHIISIYGNSMDFYKIRIFPIDKTIERQYMASYGLDMVGNVPYENHMKSIYGP